MSPHADPDFEDHDEIDDADLEDHEDAALSCGLTVDADGRELCMNAGTEWCDWDCPYSSVQQATMRRRQREAPPGPLLQIMAREK